MGISPSSGERGDEKGEGADWLHQSRDNGGRFSLDDVDVAEIFFPTRKRFGARSIVQGEKVFP